MQFIEKFNPNDPRTEGEQFLIDIFRESSTFEGFTIFEEPHINGQKPDFILVHPDQGIVIIEVKDWDLSKEKYLKDGYILGTDNKKKKRDPRHQVENYKEHILKYNLQTTVEISNVENKYFGLIETVVYFHKANRKDVDYFLDQREYQYTKVWTKEDVKKILSGESLDEKSYTYAITGRGYKFKNKDNKKMAEELISLLSYSDYNYERVEPLKLDYEQNKLAKLKPSSIRRWGGVVGSGKTIVLCDKAVRALKENHAVLIVYFNITLRSNIRDVCSQQMGEDKEERKKLRRNLTIVHFHELLSSMIGSDGLKFKKNDERTPVEDFEKFSIEAIYNTIGEKTLSDFRYDTILIDEGQDFKKEWVKVLQKLYTGIGEFFITYDRDQDLYEHSIWLEDSQEVKGLGFRGQAGTLGSSKRLPMGICVKINQVFKNTGKKLNINLTTENKQQNLLKDLIWCNREDKEAKNDLEYIYEILDSKIKKYNIKLDDITILTINDDVGVALSNFLEGNDFKISHTYDLLGEKDFESKKKEKWKFNSGTGKLKVSSFHSFKGWECPNIIFILDDIYNKASVIENGLFISMSRVKKRKSDGQYSYTCINYNKEYNYLEKEF